MKLKRLSGLLLGLFCSWTVLAQSKFELANAHSPWVNAPVFDAMGRPLSGTNYLAELWGAATPDFLAPLVLIDRGNSREIVPFLDSGYFIGTSSSDALSVLTVPPGGWAWLQVRAWEARLGATYEEAVVRGLGAYGESPLFYAQGSGFSPNGILPAPLVGLQSFNLRPATAVLLRGIRQQGDQIVIEWNPGFKRYQLQQTAVLGQPWQNVGEPTTATSATNSISGSAQFFRVIGLLE